ncbi:MAG: hypothetical protein ABSE27_05445 [Acidobacteriaceae bacterium]
MRFQWLQSVLDSSLDAALFALLTMSYVVPLGLIAILVWKRRSWRPDVAAWRWWVWHAGLVLGAVAAVAVPIFLLGIQFLPSATKQRWFIDAGTRGMFYAFVLSPVAMLLFGFGGGRQRWVGMVSVSISFVALFLSLLAMST